MSLCCLRFLGRIGGHVGPKFRFIFFDLPQLALETIKEAAVAKRANPERGRLYTGLPAILFDEIYECWTCHGANSGHLATFVKANWPMDDQPHFKKMAT